MLGVKQLPHVGDQEHRGAVLGCLGGKCVRPERIAMVSFASARLQLAVDREYRADLTGGGRPQQHEARLIEVWISSHVSLERLREGYVLGFGDFDPVHNARQNRGRPSLLASRRSTRALT